MNRWVEAALAQRRGGEACVLVSVAAVRGSAPREPGARMVVTARAVAQTIGGGSLELAAVERARALLQSGERTDLVRYPLGPALRQCCGGVATLLFERLGEAHWLERLANERQSVVLTTGAAGRCAGRKLVIRESALEGTLGDRALDAQALRVAASVNEPQLRDLAGQKVLIERLRPCDFHVVLFGAGHVGRALVGVLAGLECRVTWVDPRAGQFPAVLPANVRAVCTAAPENEVDRAPAGAFVLVMTHSHALDFELCERALQRGGLRYLGLIGSASKRARFLRNLALEGVAPAALERLTCPIGVPGIDAKDPAAIAVAVAAELLQKR